MKNLFLLNRLGFNPDVTCRKGRHAIDSIVSRFCLASLICTLLLTVGVGNVWGAEEIYKTATFTSANCTNGSSYTGTLTCTIATDSWSLVNAANNNGGWDYIKMGAKKAKASDATKVTTCYINTAAAYSDAITKVVVYGTLDRGSVSVKLIYASNSSFTTNKVESTAITSFTDGKMTFDIASPTASRYYQVQLVCSNTTTTNGVVSLTKVEYYHEAAAPAYTITAQSNNNSYGTVSLSGSVITATPTSGYRVSTSNPYSVSPANSATVSQSGNAFTVTPSANTTITINFEAIPTHNIIFNTGGLTSIANATVAEGATYNITETPAASLTNDCEYGTFVGWTTATSIADASICPAIVNSVTMSTSNVNLYAVYSKTTGGGGAVNDVLTRTTTGRPNSTTYGDWSGVSATSAAVYAGNSAGDHDAIQLRSSNNNSGIVTTTSGGNCTKVTVVWESNTADGRKIDIYGDNSAYSDATDLYGTPKGTKIGSITYGTSTELTIDDDYAYIGIRSNSGALYLTSVTLTWGGGGTTTYSLDAGCSDDPVLHVSPSSLDFGTVLQGSTPVAQTFTLSGSHLTAGNLTISAPSGYTVSPTSVAVNGALSATTITVTPNTGTIGTFTGNVTIAGGGATTVNVALSMTVNAAHTVTWYLNGDVYTAGDPTTVVASGNKVSTLPTPPAGNAIGNCANRFMGWSTSNLGYAPGQSAPTLFTTVEFSPVINNNTNFYAVFANGGGTDTELNFGYSDWGKTAMFSGEDLDEVTQTKDGITVTDTRNGASLYANTTAIRFYKKNTLTFSSSTAITSIIFEGSSWKDDVTSDVGTCTATTEGLSWTGSATSVTFSRPNNAESYVTLTSATVTVGSGAATNYRTSCGPRITADDGKWVTSSKGKKVRIEIPVRASSFASSTNLSYAITSGTGFSVKGWGANGGTVTGNLNTTVIVEYEPTSYDVFNDATLTISGTDADDAVVTIHGRSLPQKFVIAAQVNNTKKWYAVPANIDSESTPAGIELTTDNDNNPSIATANFANGSYGLEEAYTVGTAVRFKVNPGGNMLWGTDAAAGTNINDVAAANSRNQEWILTTTNGITYKIENVAYNSAVGNTPGAYKLKYYNNAQFGMFADGTEQLRLLPAGCDVNPTLGTATPATNAVELTWTYTDNAPVTIKLYSDAACTKDETAYSNKTSPTKISGLFSGYTYYYKIFSGGCMSDVGTFTTQEGAEHMSVTEWQDDAVIISFNGETTDLTLSTYKEETATEVSDNVADELFFSKYFEAEGNIKLLGIFNGTKNTINLSGYVVKVAQGTKATSWGKVYDLSPLTSIAPSEEKILISYNPTPGGSNPDPDIIACILNRNEHGLDYILVGSGQSVHSQDNVGLQFNGDDAVGLFKDGELIDIIGAGDASAADVSSVTASATETSAAAYAGGYYHDQYCWIKSGGEALDGTSPYYLSTNLCLLIRKPSVHSGENAVAKNKTDFVTLTEEWIGQRVLKDNTSTCNNFDVVGTFDYSQHFEQYSTLIKDEAFEGLKSDVDPWDGTYTIPVPGLIDMACSNVRIDLADANSGDVRIRKDFQVPIMVYGNKQTNDAIFNDNNKGPVVCQTCDVVIMKDATLTKYSSTDAEHDAVEVRDLKIYEGGKLVVPSGKIYTVNSLALRREGDAISMADIKGNLVVNKTDGVYMDLRIDPSKWHYIALPYTCTKSAITFADGTPALQGTKGNTDGKHYLLRWYNGATRATSRTGGWEDYTEVTLKKGQGYIVGLTGSGAIKKELRFPMSTDAIADEKQDKSVGYVYAYGGNKKDSELTPNHKGWNLIGNPYMMYYATDIEAPLGFDELVPDGSTYRRNETGLRYLVEPIDNGTNGYRQIAISTHMPPFTAYFVQIGTAANKDGGDNPNTPYSIAFNQSSAGKSSVARRRMPTEEEDNNRPIWYGVELIASNAEKDPTALLISDDFTDDYDMMNDLVKMRGSKYNDASVTTAPVLASRNNAGEMAFNALPDSSAAKIGVPLNFYAANSGTYTIATDSRYGLENIKEAWLFDATTQKYYDLLQSNYSFTTEAGDNTSRFRLFVTVDRSKAPEIATGNDNLLDGRLSLVTIDKTLVLSGLTNDADVYVYDMSGKLLTGEHANGNGIWRATVPATGVYFVRVNSIAGQQTLRTIVK